MRTGLGILALLALAGVAAGQQPQDLAGGKFYGPIAPKPAPKPALNLNLPTPQSESPIRLNPTPKICAVPLIEMKAPTGMDAISVNLPQTKDPMSTKPPAPSCSDFQNGL